MLHDWRKNWSSPSSRRHFLASLGEGFGALVLSHLLLQDELRAQSPSAGGKPDLNGGLHHRAKAKRVIQLFMSCGVSQVDSFDFKPALAKVDGQELGKITGIENLFFGKPGRWMKSPFRFAPCGASGKWVSELFPHTGQQVDRIAFVHSMQALSNSHGPACFQMNTGFIRPGYPSIGAWAVYGLGRETDNLPAHVVMVDRGLGQCSR